MVRDRFSGLERIHGWNRDSVRITVDFTVGTEVMFNQPYATGTDYLPALIQDI